MISPINIRSLSLVALLLLAVSCAGRGGASNLERDDSAASGRQARTRRPPRAAEEGAPGEAGEARGGRPPSAEEAARRALVLRAVLEVSDFVRAGEDVSQQVLGHQEAERKRLLRWLKDEGAWEAASRSEVDLLTTPAGGLEPARAEEAAGRREALLAVLWALGRVRALPDPGQRQVATSALEKKLPEVGAPAADFLKAVQLRPRPEIARAREAAELWQVRAWARQTMAAGRYPEGTDLDAQVEDLKKKAREEGFKLAPIRNGETFFRELIRFLAQDAYRRGLIAEPVDGDFSVGGKSYVALTEREFARVRSASAERLRALDWLAGRAPDWDAAAPVGP